MSKIASRSVLIAALSMSFACGDDNNNKDAEAINTTVVETAEVESLDFKTLGDDFAMVTSELHQGLFGIKKSLLGQEVLLALKAGNPVTSIFQSTLNTRIVRFEKIDQKIAMYNVTRTDKSYRNEPLFITSWDIEASKDDFLFLNFAKGINLLPYTAEWGGLAFYEPASEIYVDAIENAILSDIYVSKEKAVVMTLDAKVTWLPGVVMPQKLRFEFLKYEAQEGYTPLEHPENYDRVGFFTANAQKSLDGLDKVYASRFDIDSDIVYTISANTPDEFKESVRAGILYWNTYLGADKIKVIDGPEGVSAPHADYNMVQWIESDNVGLAYAQASVDPRTGRVRHASVYFSSFWAYGIQAQGTALFQESSNVDKSQKTELQNVPHTSLCDYDYSAQLQKVALKYPELLTSDEAGLLYAKDIVASVVAHEVGHTLGLRHNFAASSANEVPVTDRVAHMKTYFETEKMPEGLVVSSSVMDYTSAFEDATIGNYIRNNTADFAYDKQAMEVLYKNKDEHDVDATFGTDEHAGNFLDCAPYDYANGVFDTLAIDKNSWTNQVANFLFNGFIEQKTIKNEEIASTYLYPAGLYTYFFAISSRNSVLSALTTNAAYLTIERSHNASELYKEERIAATYVKVKEQLDAIGGLDVVFAQEENIADRILNDFEAILNDESRISGTNSYKMAYEFTADEVITMRMMVQELAEAMEKSYPKEDASALNFEFVGQLPDNDLLEPITAILNARARKYILTKSDQNFMDVVVVGDTETGIGLPILKYDQKTRMAALKLLNKSSSEAYNWAFTERKALQESVDELFIVGDVDLSELDLDAQNNQVRKYIEDLNEIKDNFDSINY